ncbi:MAG: SDR family oxidoreductase, partial [Planctomycetes bacterium]|nr:SDR family oxidoreductase [Planctomycetota bacterium]
MDGLSPLVGKGTARQPAGNTSQRQPAVASANETAANASWSQIAQPRPDRHGADVFQQPADVKDEAAVDALFAAVIERFGRVDILVNNAGAFDGGRIDEVTLDGWDNVIGACLTGTFLCSRAAFRIMKEQG